MSKYLIEGPILTVQAQLAAKIGLNEALVLQQLQYWLRTPGVGETIQGEKWIYNTYEGWKENFPFWSTKTIQRTFLSLEVMGVVVSIQPNKSKWDQTKYYRIDYQKLDDLLDSQGESKKSDCPDEEEDNLSPSLTKTTTENTVTVPDDKFPVDYAGIFQAFKDRFPSVLGDLSLRGQAGLQLGKVFERWTSLGFDADFIAQMIEGYLRDWQTKKPGEFPRQWYKLIDPVQNRFLSDRFSVDNLPWRSDGRWSLVGVDTNIREQLVRPDTMTVKRNGLPCVISWEDASRKEKMEHIKNWQGKDPTTVILGTYSQTTGEFLPDKEQF